MTCCGTKMFARWAQGGQGASGADQQFKRAFIGSQIQIRTAMLTGLWCSSPCCTHTIRTQSA